MESGKIKQMVDNKEIIQSSFIKDHSYTLYMKEEPLDKVESQCDKPYKNKLAEDMLNKEIDKHNGTNGVSPAQHIQNGSTKTKIYKCTICDVCCMYDSDLKIHMRMHSEKLHTCNICSKQFEQSSYLKTHMKIHVDRKPCTCPMCGKQFALRNYLKAHLRTHTGEKPYKCPQCGKRFSLDGNLKTHIRTHTGEKPYKCVKCNKQFSQAGSLRRHMLTHTCQKPKWDEKVPDLNLEEECERSK